MTFGNVEKSGLSSDANRVANAVTLAASSAARREPEGAPARELCSGFGSGVDPSTGSGKVAGHLPSTPVFGPAGKPCPPKHTAKVVRYEEKVVGEAEMKKYTGVARTLPYAEIQTVDDKKYTETELFGGEPSDLVVGISSTGNTKGHMYLVVDGVRIDGRMFFADHSEEDRPSLSKGMVVRYKKIPDANMQRLREFMESGEFLNSPTCVRTAAKIVFGKGGFSGGGRSNYWFPSAFLKRLASTGLIGDDGKRIEPNVTLINAEIREVWENLPTWGKVPGFLFKVLFDPYTWTGGKKKAPKAA